LPAAVRELERTAVIRRYRAKVDPAALDLGFVSCAMNIRLATCVKVPASATATS